MLAKYRRLIDWVQGRWLRRQFHHLLLSRRVSKRLQGSFCSEKPRVVSAANLLGLATRPIVFGSNRRVIPFFAAYRIASINPRDIEAFLLSLEAEELSSTSLSLHLMSLRKLMRYALNLGLIDALPIFPKVRIRKKSRGAFTPTEYVRILRAARSRLGTRIYTPLQASAHRLQQLGEHSAMVSKESERFWIMPRYWDMPPDLPWVIAFMVHSFIRPSDLKTLKHRHVEVVRGDHHYLRLTLPETKAHDKPIVTLRPAIRVYQQLSAFWGPKGLAGPDDYLFLPQEKNRAYALSVLGWMFRQVLEPLGLRDGPHGNPRTLYSLRHTAITYAAALR